MNIKLTDPDVKHFLLNLIKSIIDYREKNNYLRRDFMQLMIQLKNRGNLENHDELLNDDNQTGN